MVKNSTVINFMVLITFYTSSEYLLSFLNEDYRKLVKSESVLSVIWLHRLIFSCMLL